MKYLLLALTLVASYPVVVTAQADTNYAVGSRVICSLSDTGEVSCATDGAFTRRQPHSNLPTLTTIVASDAHVCGLTGEGAAIFWGDNDFWQTNVPEDEQFISLSAGVNNTYGVTTDNRALCWGLDTHGETAPPADRLFSQVDSDLNTSCGLKLDGSMACWGQFYLTEYFHRDYVFTGLLSQRV